MAAARASGACRPQGAPSLFRRERRQHGGARLRSSVASSWVQGRRPRAHRGIWLDDADLAGGPVRGRRVRRNPHRRAAELIGPMQELTAGAVSIDPITLEVIRHRLVSITNQIDANIKRTAFSPYIYEYNDFAVGLTDADGRLIAQCTGGMPPFIADSVGMAVRDGLSIYGRERLHHGDVVLCNHAAVQGQHLNNTVMYTPIYAGEDHGALIGFFAINVHWIDIAGAVPHSPDIFGEGLQLRSIKLWKRGEPVEEIYRIIENNTPQPFELLGDIAAQYAGCMLGRYITSRLV